MTLRRRATSLAARTLLPIAAAACLFGCAGARFESNPPGAVIEISVTGSDPWLPLEVDSDTGEPGVTPLSAIRPLSGYVFARARLVGHLPSERRLVNFSDLGREAIRFELIRSAEYDALAKLDAGLAYVDGRWLDPKAVGLVRRDEAWMTPEAAEALDQAAAGNVLVDGFWMPAAQAASLQRERLIAQGHIDYKGRLVAPVEAERMDAIDRQIALLAQRPEDAIAASDNAYVETTGRLPEGSRLKLFNATSLQAEFLVAGPNDAQSVSVAPYDDMIVPLPPGFYDIAALPVVEGSYRPYLGKVELVETFAYTIIYVGLDAASRDLEALAQRAADSPPNLTPPEIVIPEMPETKPDALPSEEGGGGGRRGGGGGGGGGPRRGGGGRG